MPASQMIEAIFTGAAAGVVYVALGVAGYLLVNKAAGRNRPVRKHRKTTPATP